MTFNQENHHVGYIAPVNNLVKLPYQAPQVIVNSSPDIEHNEGLSSDAGLTVSAS